MIRKSLVLLLSFMAATGWSQNLVPNPGFETFTSLPNAVGQWNLCPPWSNVNNATTLWPFASPDYLHTNGTGDPFLPNSGFGVVMPHSGAAIMGIHTGSDFFGQDFREYIAGQLTSPMIIGQTYTVSFWTTNGSSNLLNGGSTDHLGIHFSMGPLTQTNHEPIPVIPQWEIPGQQWSTDWMQHTFTIVATAAWTHFTVGVFLPDSQATIVVHVPSAADSSGAYYFLDDFDITQVIIPELAIAGDTLICEGESTVLTASVGTIYSWAEDSDPSQIIGTGTTLTVSPDLTTTYFVYSDGDTAQVKVEVTPLPQVSATSATVCPNEPAPLSASGADTYAWSPAAGLNTTTGSNVVATAAVSTVYTVTGTANGCSDTTQSTVTILPAPTITVNNPTICPGFSALLVVAGADSYTWSPAASLSAAVGDSVSASPTVTTVYTVTGILDGCSTSVDATVTVTPGLSLLVNDFQICAGGTAVLEATGADTYIWSPDVAFFLPDGSKVTTSPAVTTVYTVTGTNTAGTCAGIAQATVELIDHVNMSIMTSANPVLAEYPLVSFSGEPHTEELIWYFDDGDSTEGAITQHLFPAGIEGTYPVMLIVHTAGGCNDTAYVQIVVEDGGSYYVPNAFTPNGDEFNNVFKPVFSSGFDAAEYTLAIYNRWGELVFGTTNLTEGWDGTYRQLECPTGIYTWTIAAGKGKNAAAVEINGTVVLLR